MRYCLLLLICLILPSPSNGFAKSKKWTDPNGVVYRRTGNITRTSQGKVIRHYPDGTARSSDGVLYRLDGTTIRGSDGTVFFTKNGGFMTPPPTSGRGFRHPIDRRAAEFLRDLRKKYGPQSFPQ